MAPGLSSSTACGIFPDQGTNPGPLHWQVDYYPLYHQASQVYLQKKEKNFRSQIVVQWKKQCPLVLFPTEFHSQETTTFKSSRFSEFTPKFLKNLLFQGVSVLSAAYLLSTTSFSPRTHTDTLLSFILHMVT